MKLRLFLLIICLITLSYGHLDLVKIRVDSRNDAVTLDQMGIVINDIEGNEIIAEITSDQQIKLRSMGYEIKTITKDIDLVYQENFEFGRYLTYTEYIDTMRIIAQNNPSICKLDTLGTTATGLLVLAMKVSDNASVNEPEPRVFFEADIHGDEKCGWIVAWEMIKYLVRNYGSNPLVTALVNTRESWFCPMLNPWGYSQNPAQRGNSRGVDLNRNFGYMWRAQGGTAAMSELEVQAIKKAYDRDAFSIWMSYHGGAVVTLYPWGYHRDVPPDTGEFRRVCASYARATRNSYGQIIIVMYYCAGTTIDHFYGAEGMLGLGSEIHSMKTPPAGSIDSLFNAHRDPMLDLIRYAKHGVEGVITDSTTGQPIAKAMLEPTTPSRWVSYTDSPGGDYHRYLRPATYTIKFSANGYNSKTISNVVVPSDTSIILNVQLSRNQIQNNSAYKISMCNVADPSLAYANHSLTFWACGLRDNRRLSIGVGGWVNFDMGTPILNRSGNDFVVVEGDADVERCTVFVANAWNGPWTRLGVANGTTEFDLQTGGQTQARFVRLRDDGDGTANSPTAGFDVDAIEGYPLLKIEESPPIATARSLLPKLVVTPNPARRDVRFQISDVSEGNLLLKVFDVSGRQVKEHRMYVKSSSVSLGWDRKDCQGNALTAGVYFVQLNTKEHSLTKKVLLTR